MINCVLVGLGRIGFELSSDPYREKPCTHAEAIIENSHTRLIAGIDLDTDKRKTFSKKTRTPTYTSWKEYLSHHLPPDILFIATPTSSHTDYLKLGLRHLIPVVVVEKPIADNYLKAMSITNLFTKSDSPTRVIVNHERRFAEDYRYVKNKIIDKNKYGKLLSIHGLLFTGHYSSFQSLLHDGTHLLDTVAFLTKSKGKITTKGLQSMPLSVRSYDTPLRFYVDINQTPCFLEVGGKKKYFHFELNLFFERGRINIGNDIFEEWRAESSHLFKGFTSLKKKNKQFSKTHYFSNMVKHAVELYKNPSPSMSPLQDGLLVFKIIEQLKKQVPSKVK